MVQGKMMEFYLGFYNMLEEKDLLRVKERGKCFVQGSSCLLDQPEFQNINAVKPLLRIFEDPEGLQQCFKERAYENVSITIGEENANPVLHHCSVVVNRCHVESGQVGTLALIGPRRMHYARMIFLLARIGRIL